MTPPSFPEPSSSSQETAATTSGENIPPTPIPDAIDETTSATSTAPPADTTVEPAVLPLPPLSSTAILLLALAALGFGLMTQSNWLVLLGSWVALGSSLRLLLPLLLSFLADLSSQQQTMLIALPGGLLGLLGLMHSLGLNRQLLAWGRTIRWDVVGALGDFVGAFGQILIALLAVYVAWRQYIISRDLTTQQNRITQQQTIDAFFQGISELVLDDEGLLEDWPQERIIAEARTAAILSSVDATGKAKVIRFLSQSKLLTPLRRDRRLGRPILDGMGGYEEDWQHGIRVIDLGAMLASSDLAKTDLRWSDLSDANLVRTNLADCDLVKANLTRTVLYQATLAAADVMGTRFFWGAVDQASPRSRNELPDYITGAYTGAVVEGVDFTRVRRLSEEQRHYCCAWAGEKSRTTIPGGCHAIPNRLGR
ncbi:Pentapeptide-repeat containing protein [Halomicronema hongdechloris C2206]|uniref:Pentapeptide-repeat containing protein n=1 Tax=Halomicronema hongdechloris C2206 TaxID=1641165 RepID=A0A1Z3HLC0_9CYAN|nr:pentapeptide repeat-containing protein [Halomicronema hongdechloris]ASC71119.1 Pentapeptide-repeat containing protein [Halomicronema hongdechloris C2206]